MKPLNFPAGAFPVTLVLFATENVGMDSASVGRGMLIATISSSPSLISTCD